MTTREQAYKTRDFMFRRLEEDLLGGPGDDVLSEEPLARFVTGILFPEVVTESRALPSSIEDEVENDMETEEGASSSPDAASDPGVAMSHVRFPRSIGMTFAVDAPADASVQICVRAARYQQQNDEQWSRNDLPVWSENVPVGEIGIRRLGVGDGLDLVVHTRAPEDGIVAVTVTLVNMLTAEPGQRDAFCWFDPRITVRPTGTRFRERPPATVASFDEDEIASQQLLFRDVRSYAVGHGCAATWEGSEPDEVSTTFLPRHELLLSNAAGGEGLDLSMTRLADDNDFDVLERLVDMYEAWIRELASEEQNVDEDEAKVLRRHVAEATEAACRMRDGVALLRSDENVRRAFQMTNRAMSEQRSRQEFHRSGRLGTPPSTEGSGWRPFQIAFILTNLRGLADPEHPDRRIADLLWFPTGGGKTEAYLGIIGIAILLRRLRDPNAAGVSVLMRYTLRLLTLQQYQRATGLICALELQRQAELPQTAPISIGLWVGKKSTPNDIRDARAALNAARKLGSVEAEADASDPVQLRQCPWCGTALDPWNYEIVDNSWMRVACGEDTCAFRNGIPVHIVDSDVYSNRPSLVIGTVDKFAMMPWKQEVGRLLGEEDLSGASETRFLPPDLVVQDELHLISGPLGTVVGLYETAVDAITGTTAPPKVVASTATIRRAADQVRAVFARDARQFPPQGVTHRDSYFAVEAPREEKGSREYVGTMAPGSSQTTLMVRVYASLLQSAAMVSEDDPGADLYWTLLGYFNSLRILGGAYIQVLDDVPDQMGVIATRRKEHVRDAKAIREMTSRKRSSEIPRELQILEQTRGSVDAADVVLATNMISVGVDVDRLGLMVVMGQPQTSSEYIQATSRVGRRDPGLVVTIYNAGRSRDLSHYENFAAYHRTLYRHVEATGATPFAPRARDRALHAVLVALARHRIPGAAASTAAGHPDQWSAELDEQVEIILNRVSAVRSSDGSHPVDESEQRIRRELEDLVEKWTDSATVKHYEGWFDKSRGALLVEASRVISRDDESFTFPPCDPPWPTLTSMRDVDAESTVYLKRRSRRDRRGV